jgi:two-component system chemotaxis response regulator CheY
MPNTLCLVIDDSDIIRTVARKLLEQAGFEVVEASDGSGGLEICQTNAPTIVLLDWRLPDMSGIEFVQALRRASHHALPTIVYCITENDPAEIARAREAGARAILLKPFDRTSLSSALAEAGIV